MINIMSLWGVKSVMNNTKGVSPVAKNYDVKRVNKFNVILIWIFSTLLTGEAFAINGTSYGLRVAVATYGACLVASIVYFLNRYDILNITIGGIVICLSPAVAATSLNFLYKGETSARVFMLYIVCIAMVALYFKTKMLFTCSGLIIALIIASKFIEPKYYLGITPSSSELGGRLAIIVCSTVVLFFLAKWGNEYVDSALEKEKKSVELLEKLSETIKGLEEGTAVLNEQISKSNDGIHGVRQSSESVTGSISEIAKGVEQEAENITHINDMMENAGQTVSSTKALALEVKMVSAYLNEIVSDGSKKVQVMNEQMNTINHSVGAALNTVEELQQNMDEIDGFLSGITAIAEQTNLLALNAAIEAARAGDSGKGFAVVAGEVRKLAEEVAVIVDDINKIITKAQQKAEAALEKVKQGNQAVESGNVIVHEFGDVFEKTEQSFKSMDNNISVENNLIEDVTKIFENVHNELENMAAISQEYAATAEEIFATTEGQNSKIKEISEALDQIKKLSIGLKKMTE